VTVAPRATETPIVPVVARREPSGQWTLTVPRCPFCTKRYTHGGGRGREPDAGPRLSHCLENAQEYWLVVEETNGRRPRTTRRPCRDPASHVP
jgi:hypothetical protein